MISSNTNVWTANKTLTATLTDHDSKVKYYVFIKDNATKPEKDSIEWVEKSWYNPLIGIES